MSEGGNTAEFQSPEKTPAISGKDASPSDNLRTDFARTHDDGKKCTTSHEIHAYADDVVHDEMRRLSWGNNPTFSPTSFRDIENGNGKREEATNGELEVEGRPTGSVDNGLGVIDAAMFGECSENVPRNVAESSFFSAESPVSAPGPPVMMQKALE